MDSLQHDRVSIGPVQHDAAQQRTLAQAADVVPAIVLGEERQELVLAARPAGNAEGVTRLPVFFSRVLVIDTEDVHVVAEWAQLVEVNDLFRDLD